MAYSVQINLITPRYCSFLLVATLEMVKSAMWAVTASIGVVRTSANTWKALGHWTSATAQRTGATPTTATSAARCAVCLEHNNNRKYIQKDSSNGLSFYYATLLCMYQWKYTLWANSLYSASTTDDSDNTSL